MNLGLLLKKIKHILVVSSGQAEVSGVDEYSFMSYDVLQNGCINCAIHRWWIREPKLNEKKKHVDFLHSFDIGVVDDLWNGLFDVGTVLQLSALQAGYTVGCITGLGDASPGIIQLDHHRHPKLISVLLCETPFFTQGTAGPQWWQEVRPLEWIRIRDCGTSWSGSCLLQKPGATFTASCISIHLFRRDILEILRSKENYNKM